MMASQGTTTSRLAQIQMRFQQKQLQEREQRKIEMTASKPGVLATDDLTILNITTKSTTSLSSSIGNGKVRQMFNERRKGAGVDRSNPLKPITSRSTPSSTRVTTNTSIQNANQSFNRRQEITALRPINGRKLEKINTNKLTSQRNNNSNDTVDGILDKNSTFRADEFDLNNETFPDHDNFEITLPARIEGIRLDSDVNGNGDCYNNLPDNESIKLNSRIKLNPILTKKSLPSMAAKLPPSRAKQNSITSNQCESPVNTTQKPISSKPKAVVKATQKMVKPLGNTMVKKTEGATNPPPGTAPCRICNRFFNEDRVSKHEAVCEKTATKQRKVFDASKHRVKGTDAEKYVKKPLRGSKTALKSASPSTSDTSKKSNWRKKHEEFIAAIRAAKEVQAHLARGGKLSDLPPPPPSENPDYITCPHCSRRFNEAAANRHIPKCANMLHNKPKPGNKRR